MITEYLFDKFEIAVRCFFGTLGVVFLLVMFFCVVAVVAVLIDDYKKSHNK